MQPEPKPVATVLDMRVDAHVSLWETAPPEARRHVRFPGDDRSYLPRHIAPILERSRFDGAIVVTTGTGEAERAQMAAWCAEPGRLLGVVAGWSSDIPSSSAIRDLVSAGKLCGVWLSLETEQPLAEAVWRPALEFCQQEGLALEIAPPLGLTMLEQLAGIAQVAMPTPLVLSHLAGVPSESADIAAWMERTRALAQQPNVVCKLSAVHSGAARTWPLPQLGALFQFLIASFGEQRLMYGSDWPYCLPEHAWKACLARFTQALGARTMQFREHILGGTAIRAYGLARAGGGSLSEDAASSTIGDL